MSCNADVFREILHGLSVRRSHVSRGAVRRHGAREALRALFWVGVPWASDGVPACGGLGGLCAYAVGATQISVEEADTNAGTTWLLLTTYLLLTYYLLTTYYLLLTYYLLIT